MKRFVHEQNPAETIHKPKKKRGLCKTICTKYNKNLYNLL